MGVSPVFLVLVATASAAVGFSPAAARVSSPHAALASIAPLRAAQRHCFACPPRMASAADAAGAADAADAADGGSAASSDAKPKLTLKQVAELVETTFVRSCMDLATGQIDSLKLFIVAAKAGFEIGAAMSALELALSLCEHQTANRDLLPEEIELRSLISPPRRPISPICRTTLSPISQNLILFWNRVFSFSTQTTHFSHMSHTHFPEISEFDSFFSSSGHSGALSSI